MKNLPTPIHGKWDVYSWALAISEQSGRVSAHSIALMPTKQAYAALKCEVESLQLLTEKFAAQLEWKDPDKSRIETLNKIRSEIYHK